MKIIVEVKQVYGVNTVYPICEKARVFCDMCGTKTLTPRMVQDIKKLGYEIEVKQLVSL